MNKHQICRYLNKHASIFVIFSLEEWKSKTHNTDDIHLHCISRNSRLCKSWSLEEDINRTLNKVVTIGKMPEYWINNFSFCWRLSIPRVLQTRFVLSDDQFCNARCLGLLVCVTLSGETMPLYLRHLLAFRWHEQ